MSLTAGLGRVDDVVDVAPLGRHVRVGEALGVLVDQLGPAGDRIGGVLQLAAVEDLDRALRAHHRQLGRRPGEGEVGADRLGVHDHVGAAVGLAGDDLDAGHGGLAVGVEQLGAVADDAAVLLVDAGQEPGHVDEGDERDVERVAACARTGPPSRTTRCRARRRAPSAGCRRCRPAGRRGGRSRTRSSRPTWGSTRRSRRRRRRPR